MCLPGFRCRCQSSSARVQRRRLLFDAGAKVKAFDPKAMENAKRLLDGKLELGSDAYEVCEGADALLILTEWNEFRRPSFERLKTLLKEPVIFDGRNLYEGEAMARRGFSYHSIGRPSVELGRTPLGAS